MGSGRTSTIGKSNNITKSNRRNEMKDVFSQTQQAQTSTSESVSQNNNINTPHYKDTVDNFRNMSINDAVNFYNNIQTSISSADIQALNLRDSGYQKTVLALGLHDKPLVLSDKDFDKSFKTESATPLLYRGLGDASFVDNSKYSDLLFASNGIHGNGAAYLTTRKGYAQQYGYGKDYKGNDKGYTAYIDKSKMKSVTESDLRFMLARESSVVKQSFTGNSGLGSYALYKGYNCIHVPGGNAGGHHAALNNSYAYKKVNGRTQGEDYYVPLTRGILVIREHAK